VPPHGWGVVAVAWALVAACGADDAGRGETGAGAEAALPAAVCDLLDRYDEAEEPLSAPGVYALDEAALADVLATRLAVLSDLATAGVEGGLGDDIVRWAEAQPAVDRAMVDGWDEERVRLARDHEDRWVEAAVGDRVTGEDGSALDLGDHWATSGAAYDRLVVGCRAPELADPPASPEGARPSPGRIVYYRPAAGPEEQAALQVVDERGEDVGEIVVSERPNAGGDRGAWVPTGMIDVAPGDDGHLLVNVRSEDGREYAMVEVDGEGTIVRFPQRSTDGWIDCPGWDAGGERLLAVYPSSRAGERHVVHIDMTGATPAGRAPLPFATAGCADFVTDDRIVVSEAALDLDDERAVWTVGLDGSAPEELYRAEGCGTQVGAVNPAGTHVALAQSCEDPLDGGIVVVDLATGEDQRVATGTAALPKWSPDGEWLAFGYAPLGEGGDLGAWLARPDGRGLHEAVGSPAWFPAWLPG
jgi:hypothetical protein